jgi:hypothetical protein
LGAKREEKMKHNAHLWRLSLALVVLGVFWVNCGGKGEIPTDKLAEHLVDTFNKRLPGTTFKTDLENCIIEPAEEKGHRITFKDSTLTTDFTEMLKLINKGLPLEENSHSYPNTAQIKEIVVRYNPKDVTLELLSFRGFSIESILSKHEGSKKIPKLGTVKMNKIHLYVEQIISPGMDVSPILRDDKTDSEKTKNDNDKAGNSGSQKNTIVKNIELEFNYILNGIDNFSVIFGMEEFEINPGIDNPYLTAYPLSKEKQELDLKKIIEKKMTMMDFSTQLEKLKISIRRSTSQWDILFIDNIDFSCFMKPEKSGNFFKMGYELEINNVRLVFPLKKEIEQLVNFKEIKFGFLIEDLKPRAIGALFKLMNTAFEWRSMTEHPGKQEDIFQKMSLITDIISSKPTIKLYLSPIKHGFGELNAEAVILSLLPLSSQLKVNIFKVDEILEQLTATRLFLPTTMEKISQFISTATLKDSNGDASMLIEIKGDQPGKLYLNGKPFPFNPSRFAISNYFDLYR